MLIDFKHNSLPLLPTPAPSTNLLRFLISIFRSNSGSIKAIARSEGPQEVRIGDRTENYKSEAADHCPSWRSWKTKQPLLDDF